MGGDEDDVALGAGCAIGQGLSTGDTGSEVEGEEGGADARLAFDQGDSAQRDALFPEPGEGLGGSMGEQHAGGTDGRKKWRMICAAGKVAVVGFLDFVGAGEGSVDGALASSFFAHGFRDGLEGGDVFFAL